MTLPTYCFLVFVRAIAAGLITLILCMFAGISDTDVIAPLALIAASTWGACSAVHLAGKQ